MSTSKEVSDSLFESFPHEERELCDLSLRAGEFIRETHVTPEDVPSYLRGREGTWRVVTISNCQVTWWKGDNKLNGHSFDVGDKLQLNVTAGQQPPHWREQDLEKIGALDGMNANLVLPPEAFASFWTAAERYGSACRIELRVKPFPDPNMHILSVTDVQLIESMPTVHPVVAELRSMQETLSGLRFVVVIFLVFFVVGYVLSRLL